jgi:hypothetical protein
MMMTGCQQQVPEIFYDLDAQSMSSKTRAVQQQILYQAPLSMVIDKELQLFHGKIVHLDRNTKDENSAVEIKVKNEMGVVLEFEVSLEVAALMNLKMDLAVRYMRGEPKNEVVEIRKGAW